MKNNVKITKTTHSKIDSVDFSNIPFGHIFSDHMYLADYKDGKWGNERIVPFGPLPISPINLALNYGQSIFEGMKASKLNDGTPVFMRPALHSERMNISATRMAMPTIPEEMFLNALHTLVDLEKSWIPATKGSSLYIRPLMWASDELLGVKVSKTYTFCIMTGPVGPYYPKPVSLLAQDKYVRAVRGGVGFAKTAGNYAASLLPAQEAIKSGYDQVMWLDAIHKKYVQEVGTMNIFFVIDGVVVTPELDGAILAGITRQSVIEILKQKNYKVEERKVDINEIVLAHKEGKLQEIFGTGTAAVIAKVYKLKYNEDVMELPEKTEDHISSFLLNEINSLRFGDIEDKNGWIVPVKSSVLL